MGVDEDVALQMACALWKPEAQDLLLDKLADTGAMNVNQVAEAWRTWLDRLSAGQNPQMVRAAVRAGLRIVLSESVPSEVAQAWTTVSLHSWFNTSCPPSDQDLCDLMAYTRAQARKSPSLAGCLAKWLAHGMHPDLVRSGIDWFVDPDGRFAIPIRAYEPIPVAECLALLADHPHMRLPDLIELRFKECRVGERELIRDKFPPGYSYGETRLFPAQFATWDGMSMGHLDKSEISGGKLGGHEEVDDGTFHSSSRTRVAWRPSMLLRVTQNK